MSVEGRPEDGSAMAPDAMAESSPRVLEVARRVREGEAVDWDDAGRAATPGEAELIRALRAVARIVEAHRSLHGGGSGPADATKGAPALRRWGPLEILDRVGQGTGGEVYRARDERLDRIVALKLIRPHATPGSGMQEDRAPLEEGRLLARVRHPHVVTVYGAERHDGRTGLWMEFLSGRTLARWLDDRGTLGAREAGLIGLDLCQALAAVHRAGLVHRDVKAQNVMREEGGRIVLTDFGIGGETRAGLVDGERVSGTPLYMAPEILAGGAASPASDLYALGVLLYHLVSAAFPVEGRSVEEIRDRHAKGTARPLGERRPDLPPAFVRVVERAMAHDPADRFASAAAMEQALAAALGVEAAAPAPAPGRPAPLRWPLVAAATLLIVAVAIWIAGRREPAPPTPPSSTATVPASGPAPAAATAIEAAPASPPGVAGTFTVQAAFFRGTGVRERLGPDDRLEVGEALSLDFEASRDLYLYVVDEDDAGTAVLLFPLPDGGSAPLSGGRSHTLPGASGGRQQYWQVTSPGGREHFLLVASAERLLPLERETSDMLRPEAGRPLATRNLSDEALAHLRGVAGLVSAPPRPGAPRTRLFESAARLSAGHETATGTWVRRFDVRSAAPTGG